MAANTHKGCKWRAAACTSRLCPCAKCARADPGRQVRLVAQPIRLLRLSAPTPEQPTLHARTVICTVQRAEALPFERGPLCCCSYKLSLPRLASCSCALKVTPTCIGGQRAARLQQANRMHAWRRPKCLKAHPGRAQRLCMPQALLHRKQWSPITAVV